MSKVEYPRTVYVLTHGYNVRKVTLVRPASEHYDYGGYTKGSQYHRRQDIHETKAKAIKAGRANLRRRQKALEAGLELVAKQSAALDKAAGIAAPHPTVTGEKEGGAS